MKVVYRDRNDVVDASRENERVDHSIHCLMDYFTVNFMSLRR